MEEDIKNRWMSYFQQLFNEDCENSIDFTEFSTLKESKNYSYIRRISKAEVWKALKKMKHKKAVRPDNIPIDV
ncbi:hypothetical protein AXF42_Ash014950 [Apostasia shenzhenica]|uniref:Uncharacterized protein n=1 Tax=Apostasia shenzhenica TaxID=1088818 RepID=A0A2I0ALM4_9ASPA|nr:hypothetical protein AXF42_Ash014950 [Apostasia shenzhenica]